MNSDPIESNINVVYKMDFAPDHNVQSQSSAPNNGVTNFLRHFSNHRNTKEVSHLKKTNRMFRNLGRSSTYNNAKISSQYDDTAITTSSICESKTAAFHRTKGNFFSHKEDEDMITFEPDSTRLGIRPTCYDVASIAMFNDGTPTSNNNNIDEEVYFLNNNVAAATSVTPLSSTSVPNLFASLPIWEETRQDELQESSHRHRRDGSTSLSPQKSAGSCDSIKSDGSIDEEEEYRSFILPPASSPSKHRSSRNRVRSSGSSNAISTKLMQKAKSIVQRSRDKENHSCDGSQISTTSSAVSASKESRKSKSGATKSTQVDTVKIFLLLVEPKSKVFELIQLMYPRNKTKVIDLLKMIPKNATEQALATQSYVGITRPKRRADPITDLNFLASNSVFNTSGDPTAAIESGEIIVAIPALTSTKEIVVLSKQILASAHIQKLISISKGQNGGGSTMDVSGRSRLVKKRTSITTTGSLSKKSSTSSLLGSNYPDLATTFCPIQNDSRSPKIVSFVSENCTEELKRAIDNANLANEEAGCSPSITPTSFLSASVDANDTGNKTKTVEFPRDMLDAYMSKDDVLKMCSTPNNTCKIPNIECTSSSSMVDDTEETDVDASSCDGSMTSSFHSWALSFDSTSIPSINRGNLCAGKDYSIASKAQFQGQKKKRFFTKKIKRVAMVSFMSSIARYHVDPNGIYSIQNLRRLKLFEPMGLVGLVYLVLTFGALLKLQMHYNRQSSSGIVPLKTRCPVLRSIAKVYKRIQHIIAFDKSTKVEDSRRREQSLVPTSIHAIKYE